MAERKVYVTKYALTDGISVRTVNERFAKYCRDGATCVNWPGAIDGRLHLHRGEWHGTVEEAQVRVREMAARKLKSLDKQRAKLEKLVRGGAEVRDG